MTQLRESREKSGSTREARDHYARNPVTLSACRTWDPALADGLRGMSQLWSAAPEVEKPWKCQR